MNEPMWEGPVCFLCNYWWVILLVIVLGVVAYFTSPYWLPLLGLA
jgi:hypothetical protein